MGYRTERKHKQEQRAYANWQCQQDREQDEYFDHQPPLTEAEIHQLEAWHRDRLQDEGRMR